MRTAVYAGTRNVYDRMLAPAKSLLMHSNVDKIYFLIEDNNFPDELPKEIECINVSNQQWFDENGPNFINPCSYMVLLRAAYTKLFPNLDKILNLDIDTLVNENISELWDLDLTDYYLAAVEEVDLTVQKGSYVNMGVSMFNLKKLRDEGQDDKLIYALNTRRYRLKEQDCFNEFFRGNILILPSDYNGCLQAKPPQREKITHFAGLYGLMDEFPHFNYYKNLKLSTLERNIPTTITLDIIIPTYNNKDKLRRILNSINYTLSINVIVIDNCSNLDYSDILEEYPFIQLYKLDTIQTPDMVWQYGIEHSNGTYFTFLDTKECFYNSELNTIINSIKQNTYIKMFIFSQKNNIINNFVYKRSFIEMYNIHFNEKKLPHHQCKMILKDLEKYGFSRSFKKIIISS